MSVPQSFSLELYPGMNRFVLDRLAGSAAASRFIPAAVPRTGPRAVTPELADAIVRSNVAWGIDARSAVDAWRDGSQTFVAGQQVGFAGGPVYTLSKIATLLYMKREAEARGERATAFFWLATEDHDYAEVAQLAVPASVLPQSARQNLHCDLLRLRARSRDSERSVVGSLPIPDSLRRSFIDALGIATPYWLRDGITFRDSFAELIVEVFASEIVLIDSLLPELRRAGAPLFDRVSAGIDTAQRRLAVRAAELESAGYGAQVTAREGDYTLFFRVDDSGERVPVDHTEGVAPERVSTSALTRPLLQDAVLQPDVFVGGPAEVAYYAQVAVLHELAGVPLPRVSLRGHALLAPPRTMRCLDRLGISAEQAFSDADTILAPRESETIAELDRMAGEAGELIRGHAERVRALALPADHSLARSIERSVGHLDYHLRKLTERASRSVVRKDRERHAAAREVVATFFPDDHVQERVASWYAYLLRHGDGVIARLAQRCAPDRAECAVVPL